MCSLTMLAPADVPPTTPPRAWTSTIASPNARADADRGELELVAAGHEHRVDVVELLREHADPAPRPGSRAAATTTSAAPSRRNSASYSSTTSSPSVDAVGTIAIAGSARPAGRSAAGARGGRPCPRRRRSRTPRPGATGIASGGTGPREARGRGVVGMRSERTESLVDEMLNPCPTRLMIARSSCSVTPRRCPTACTDHERKLAKRGHADAAAVGRWFVEAGHDVRAGRSARPSVRTRETWADARARRASAPDDVRYDDRVYDASVDDLLDVLADVPDDVDVRARRRSRAGDPGAGRPAGRPRPQRRRVAARDAPRRSRPAASPCSRSTSAGPTSPSTPPS